MFHLKESPGMLQERGARLHAAMDMVIPQQNWSRPEIEAHQWHQL